jgi:hypothetical protein
VIVHKHISSAQSIVCWSSNVMVATVASISCPKRRSFEAETLVHPGDAQDPTTDCRESAVSLQEAVDDSL